MPPTRPRILFACTIEDAAARQRMLEVADIDEIAVTDPAELQRLAAPYDGLIVPYTAHPLLTREVIAACPRLRLAGTTYGGVGQNVDTAAAFERGLTLIHTAPVRDRPMAEYTLALILGALTRIPHYHHALCAGEAWPRLKFGRTRVLHERRVAVIGFGRIGQAIAQLLKHFTPHVSVVSRHTQPQDAPGFELVSLEDAFAQHEVVVLAGGYTPATHQMILAKHFALMADDALFVNIARGAMVDQAAMIDAAQRRPIHLALDVFDPEPLALDSPLRSMARVTLVPHRANAPIEFEQRWAFLADELTRFARGETPLTALSPERAAVMSAS